MLERTGSCSGTNDIICLRYVIGETNNYTYYPTTECLTPGEQLPKEQFCRCSFDWPVLQLWDRGINSIKADVFKDMPQLEDLNLGKNNLSTLPAGLFDTNTALKVVYMHSNNLQSLPANLFEKNEALE